MLRLAATCGILLLFVVVALAAGSNAILETGVVVAVVPSVVLRIMDR